MDALFAATLLVMAISPLAQPTTALSFALTYDEVLNISSTNFPGNYNNNENREWTVTSELGTKISIRVHVLDIESHSNCDYDKLTIIDYITGENLYEGCGNRLPSEQIFSKSNRVIVRFKSDGSSTRQGFFLEMKQLYQPIQDYATYLTLTSGGVVNISSTNFPRKYNNNEDRQWKVTSDSGSRISIQIRALDIQPHPDCLFDTLMIVDTTVVGVDELLYEGCGNTLPSAPIISNSNRVTVLFDSDEDLAYTGFFLELRQLSKPSIASSNLTLTSHGAVNISSTNFPGNYSNYENREWTITSENGSSVRTSPTNQGVSTYTSQKANARLLGNISSPNFPEHYNSNENLRWQVTAAEGTVIQVEFVFLDIEYNSNCAYDKLTIVDLEGNETLYQGCGNSAPLTSIISKSHQIQVRFKTDGSVNRNGFLLQFKEVAIIPAIETKKIITSPNFPGKYYNSENLYWDITVPFGKKINITFEAVDIEYEENCEYDKLSLFELTTNDVIYEVCGNRSSVPYIVSRSNQVRVKFVSDSSTTKTGFQLTWEACETCEPSSTINIQRNANSENDSASDEDDSLLMSSPRP